MRAKQIVDVLLEDEDDDLIPNARQYVNEPSTKYWHEVWQITRQDLTPALRGLGYRITSFYRRKRGAIGMHLIGTTEATRRLQTMDDADRVKHALYAVVRDKFVTGGNFPPIEIRVWMWDDKLTVDIMKSIPHPEVEPPGPPGSHPGGPHPYG